MQGVDADTEAQSQIGWTGALLVNEPGDDDEAEVDSDEGICPHHFADEFLRDRAEELKAYASCVLCGALPPVSAAPLEEMLDLFKRGMHLEFKDPAEFLPYDSAEGGYQGTVMDTAEVVDDLSWAFNDYETQELFTERLNDGDIWARPWHTDLSWLTDSWSAFVRRVKHHSRFWMGATKGEEDHTFEMTPRQMLNRVAAVAVNEDLVGTLQITQHLFRVRAGGDYKEPKDLGAPPAERCTSANRMSPPGISAFYAALDATTAILEVPPVPHGTLSDWHPKRPLLVLDLSHDVVVPSLFDTSDRQRRAALLFMREFQKDISKPVPRNAAEHIDYVPTQVVAEFFHHVFRTPENEVLDGIVYQSSYRNGGRNVVLFRAGDFNTPWRESSAIDLSSVKYFSAADIARLISAG